MRSWRSTPAGFTAFVKGNLDRVPGTSDVKQIIEDRDGGFWVSGIQELFEMRGSKPSCTPRTEVLPEHSVDIHQDSTGTLWIASYGGGLSRLRDGRLTSITTNDGLPNNMLAGMLEDTRGNLWISSTQNIFCLRLKELNDLADGRISSVLPVSYGAAEGMRSSESTLGARQAWKLTTGGYGFLPMRGVGGHRPDCG